MMRKIIAGQNEELNEAAYRQIIEQHTKEFMMKIEEFCKHDVSTEDNLKKLITDIQKLFSDKIHKMYIMINTDLEIINDMALDELLCTSSKYQDDNSKFNKYFSLKIIQYLLQREIFGIIDTINVLPLDKNKINESIIKQLEQFEINVLALLRPYKKVIQIDADKKRPNTEHSKMNRFNFYRLLVLRIYKKAETLFDDDYFNKEHKEGNLIKDKCYFDNKRREIAEDFNLLKESASDVENYDKSIF